MLFDEEDSIHKVVVDVEGTKDFVEFLQAARPDLYEFWESQKKGNFCERTPENTGAICIGCYSLGFESSCDNCSQKSNEWYELSHKWNQVNGYDNLVRDNKFGYHMKVKTV